MAAPPPTAPSSGVPGTDADVIAEMVAAVGSLRETVDHLQGLLEALASRAAVASPPAGPAVIPNGKPATPAPPTVPPVHHGTSVTPAPAVAVAAPAAVSVVDADLVAQMLDVVADKTGYPVEILELSMALEADLGIDSIKRVEILAAVQERIPALPDVETATMATLVTLQEIVDYLQNLTTPPVHNGTSDTPAPAVAVAAPAAVSVVDADLVAQMLDVVADKTGYPVEILELSMALEADLGIDSIKRVEILAAVQERIPALPDVETATMATLVTLQEIVDYLQNLTTPPCTTAPR